MEVKVKELAKNTKGREEQIVSTSGYRNRQFSQQCQDKSEGIRLRLKTPIIIVLQQQDTSQN